MSDLHENLNTANQVQARGQKPEPAVTAESELADVHHDLKLAVGDTYRTAGSAAFEVMRRLAAAEAAVERVRKHADEIGAMALAEWEADEVSQAVRAEMLRNARAIQRALRASHSPAEPVSPVSTPTEAHGETGEAQEGSEGTAFDPQPGDLWRDREGDLWFAIEEQSGDFDNPDMACENGQRGYPNDVDSQFGPLVRVHRKG